LKNEFGVPKFGKWKNGKADPKTRKNKNLKIEIRNRVPQTGGRMEGGGQIAEKKLELNPIREVLHCRETQSTLPCRLHKHSVIEDAIAPIPSKS